jgi:zinc protease
LLKLPQDCGLLEIPANTIQLTNGLTVIHQHLPATPVVVTDIWVKAGAIVEPDSWSGMAHFLEHAIFKGSDRLGAGEFDRSIEAMGGSSNAATSHDYAHFFLTTAALHFQESLPYLAEIVLQAAIPDEEFAKERNVVLEEIRSSYDDPDWIAFQALCQTVYQTHPYKRSVLGDEELLLSLTPNQMRCFHGTYYQPENMTVVVVGGVGEEEAIRTIERTFNNFKARSECPIEIIEAEPPTIDIRRQEIVLPRLEGARLTMAWLGSGAEHLEDAFGLDLLSIIVACGRCSRLVEELREEKQLVFDIASSFSLQQDSSLFTINAYLEDKYLGEVEKIIVERLWEFQNRPIAIEELQRAQRILCNDYIFSTETPGQLAGLYGYYQTIAEANMAFIYPRAIANFTTADIQRIASQYLSPERYAIVSVTGY